MFERQCLSSVSGPVGAVGAAYYPVMRARALAVPLALLALTSCSGETDESAPLAAQSTPETYGLVVEVTDGSPLDLAMNVDDKVCRPSALFSKVEDAAIPSFVVEDASGVTVATGEMKWDGEWGGESCTLTTDLGEVPASDFYTVRLAGDDGLFEVEAFEFETTVQAAPVDGVVTVEWTL